MEAFRYAQDQSDLQAVVAEPHGEQSRNDRHNIVRRTNDIQYLHSRADNVCRTNGFLCGTHTSDVLRIPSAGLVLGCVSSADYIGGYHSPSSMALLSPTLTDRHRGLLHERGGLGRLRGPSSAHQNQSTPVGLPV